MAAVAFLAVALAIQSAWLLALALAASGLSLVVTRLRLQQEKVHLRFEDSALSIKGDGFDISLQAPFRYQSGVERRPATDQDAETCFVRLALDNHGKPLVLEEEVTEGRIPPKLDSIYGVSSALGIADLTSCTPFPGTLWSLIQRLESLASSAADNLAGEDLSALFQLAKLQLSEGLYSQAIDTYSAIVRQRPRSPAAYYSRALARYKQGRELDKAINDLSTSLRLDPDRFEAYRMRALTRGRAGDWAGMREDCTLALRLQPNSAELYNLRANACYALQDFEAALADYNRAIELDGSRYESFFNRGLIKQRQKRFHDALGDFRIARRLNPNFAAAAHSIASVENHLAKLKRERAV